MKRQIAELVLENGTKCPQKWPKNFCMRTLFYAHSSVAKFHIKYERCTENFWPFSVEVG